MSDALNRKREVLFSVTAADCDWDYSRSSGKGGQNVNKVNSKVRCTHRDSGAVGVAQDTRDQKHNKRLAFVRMAEHPKFKAWHKMECARVLGRLKNIEETVETAMHPSKIKVEGKKDGKWVAIEEATPGQS